MKLNWGEQLLLIFIKMIITQEDCEMARAAFNDLDYNNQRNFLWSVAGQVDRVQDEVQGNLYCDKQPELNVLAGAFMGSRARRMVLVLTDIGQQSTLNRLLGAIK